MCWSAEGVRRPVVCWRRAGGGGSYDFFEGADDKAGLRGVEGDAVVVRVRVAPWGWGDASGAGALYIVGWVRGWRKVSGVGLGQE